VYTTTVTQGRVSRGGVVTGWRACIPSDRENGMCVHLVNNSDAGESLAADSEDEKLQRGECSSCSAAVAVGAATRWACEELLRAQEDTER